MSKNVYFNDVLIPSKSFRSLRIGSKYSRSKEEARAKFIENIGLIVSLTPDWKEIVKDNPSLVEVDEEKPSGKESFSKYYIRLKAPESLPRINYVNPNLVTDMDPEFVTETVLGARQNAEKWEEEDSNILNQPEGDEGDLEYEDEELLDSSFKKSEKQLKETGEHLVGLEDELDDLILGDGPRYREEVSGTSDEENPEYYEDDLDKDLDGGKRRRRTRKNKRCKKIKTKKRTTRRSTKKKHQKKRKETRKR